MVTGSSALKAAATGKPSDIAAAAKAAGTEMKPKDMVKHMLEQNKLVIAEALPRHMNPERLLRVAITSVTSNPALLECYVPTLIGGIIQCAQMGLEPNTVLGHAYLIPFWNSDKNRKDVTVIIGYKGLIDLARRSGQIVSIAAHAVYTHDTFEFEYGLDEKLRHIPADGDRGEILKFYAVAHMKDGGHAFEVMAADVVRKIRDTAAIKNRAKRDASGALIIKGPWNDHFEEMGRKTVIRRLAKYLPLSIEMATAVVMEDTSARGEPQNLDGVLDGDYTLRTDEEVAAVTDQTQAGEPEKKGKPTNGAEKKDTAVDKTTGEMPLAEIERICKAAIEIADTDTAFLRLDDAKIILPPLSEELKKQARFIIDEAEAMIKARKAKAT